MHRRPPRLLARLQDEERALAGKTNPWVLATSAVPCPICKHDDWCQVSGDGAVAMCMRTEVGAFKSQETQTGAVAHYHRLKDPAELPGYRPVTAEPDGQRADTDTLNKVYAILLGELQLSESHRLDLVR